MTKPVLAVDVDEVLFPLLDGFTVWHNQAYGTSLTVSMFKTYRFADTLGMEVPESIDRIRRFISNGHATVEPIRDAQNAIKRLAETYTIVIVTARFPDLRGVTEEYLDTYFMSHIKDIHMAGYPGDLYGVRPKVEICSEINAVALIDDSFRHVNDCARAGMQGVLFGDYAWNRQEGPLPERIVRCSNWSEVVEFFDV
jgi:uncharacterized HAD superfamily protein